MGTPENAPDLPELRVLHVLSNLGIGGAEVWVLALLRYFRDEAETLGVKVKSDIFLTLGFRDQLDDEAEQLGANLHYARYSRQSLPAFVRAWRRQLKQGDYHAIHDHQEFSAGWHFLMGRGLLPSVRIAHLHNPMEHQRTYASGGWVRRQTITLGNRAVISQGTHLLSTSQQLIREQGFDDLPGAEKLNREALHCGFDTRRFLGDRDLDHRSVRKEFGIPVDSKILLFVGRLDSHQDETRNQKNPAFCLEVARNCIRRDSSVFCLMAGSGETAAKRLRERVRSWELHDRIFLIGARSDIPRLMRGSDLLLMPSFEEGLGMVAVEAQAAGLPVLASEAVPKECAVIPEMVNYCSLSEPCDHWATEVFRLISTTSLSIGEANLKVTNSKFSIANSATRLMEIYSSST